MNIYEALTKDHDELKPLLDQLVATSEHNESTKQLLDQIREALVPHSRAEEAVFYNALREIPATKEIVGHSFREHKEAEAILMALRGLEKISIEWTGAARKLREALLHHIADEQGRVFPAARQVLFDEEARQMAVAFQQAKRETAQRGNVRHLERSIANLMPTRFAKTGRNVRVPRV